jgi:hypothetical protein
MARKLDDIFNECYERIRSGESLESCLRSYPQYRHELEPLLRTTFDIGRRMSYIHPRPEFRHWARIRIESAQQYPRQQPVVERSAFPGWLRHGWALATVAGIIVLLGTGTTMAASSNALPTEPLYPVKLATEQVQLAFAVSPERKAEVETDLVNKRADELEAMANAGKTEEAVKAAERYDTQFEKAIQAIIKAGGTDTTEIPPVVTTPSVTIPSVTIPPTATTSPTVTSNTTKPTTGTTPVITPPTTGKPPVVTAVSENTTPTGTTTPPATQQPSTPNQQTSTSTTNDNSQASKIDNLKKSLDRSTSRSLTALKDAQEKASDNTKPDWQSAYDKIKDRQTNWSKDSTSASDNTTIQKQDTSSPGRDRSSKQNHGSSHR